MKEKNKIKLGAFLLLSITLLVVSFTAAGIGKLFAPKLRAMTTLNTSVEGLNVGSPVKYLGMTVGKVTGLSMRTNSSQIVIYFDLFPDVIEDDFLGDGVFDRRDLDQLLSKDSLHCFVNAAGIMGGTYLELEFTESRKKEKEKGKEKEKPQTTPVKTPRGVCYIPSRPSHIGNAIQNVSRLLEDIRGINFMQFANKLEKLLDNMQQIIVKNNLNHTLATLNNTCENMERVTKRLDKTLSDENMNRLHKTIADLQTMSHELAGVTRSKQLQDLAKNLNAFSEEGTKLLRSTEEENSKTVERLRRIEQSLTRLDNTLAELSAIAAEIGDDPTQFIRGKSSRE